MKTRLTPPLTPNGAAALYEAFLEDTLSTCRQVPDAELVLFDGSPGEKWGSLPVNTPVILQTGRDLGERMTRALEFLLESGAREAVLVGSDSPTLPARVIQGAFELLNHHDVVLGPSRDGGFYLIGVTDPPGFLLEGISWSTSTVFAETVKRVEERGLRLGTTESWYDIDNPEDLEELRHEVESYPTVAPATRLTLDRIFPP